MHDPKSLPQPDDAGFTPPKDTLSSESRSQPPQFQKVHRPTTAQGKKNSSRNARKHCLLAKDIVITTGPGKENSYYDGIIRISTIGKLVKSTKIASRSAHRAVTDQFLRSEHVTRDAQPLLQCCWKIGFPEYGYRVRKSGCPPTALSAAFCSLFQRRRGVGLS